MRRKCHCARCPYLTALCGSFAHCQRVQVSGADGRNLIVKTFTEPEGDSLYSENDQQIFSCINADSGQCVKETVLPFRTNEQFLQTLVNGTTLYAFSPAENTFTVRELTTGEEIQRVESVTERPVQYGQLLYASDNRVIFSEEYEDAAEQAQLYFWLDLSDIDYTSHHQVYLCARPECTHDTDDCTSVIRGNIYVFAANNQLYLLGTADENSSPPALISSALDGSGRRTLTQFPSNYQFDPRIYTDDTALYILMDIVESQTAQAQRQLVRVNLTSGAYDTVCTFPPEYTMLYPAGAAGRRLIFAQLQYDSGAEDYTTVYHFLDVDTGSFVEEEKLAVDIQNGSFWEGGKLYEILYEEETIRITDPVTGSESTHSYAQVYQIPGYPAFKHDIGAFAVDEGCVGLSLRAEDSSDEKNYVFHLDLNSGEITPFTLFKTFKPQPITVMAKQKDILLVTVDYIEAVGDDMMHTYTPTPKYALITEENYKASAAEYTPIESYFYPNAWA